MKRDINSEEQLHNIDENSALNGLYLLSLINLLKNSTLDELAVAMYLFRFSNVTSSLLKIKDKEIFESFLPEWELYNLDIKLSNYIIEKYDKRFMNGLKELVAREIIKIKGQQVELNDNLRSEVEELFKKEEFNIIIHKSYFITKIIKESSINHLNQEIKKINGGI